MNANRVVVVGAGMGGLAAAIALATQGVEVVVLEKGDAPGGKMRRIEAGGLKIDSGPTVFTMRWVFDEIFDAAGASLADSIGLRRASVIARHAWSESERLDLFGDVEESAAAIGDFAGAAEARGYLAFCERARKTYEMLEGPFILSADPTPLSVAMDVGFFDMWRISPFSTLWRALGEHFRDLRLRQLFARYATYCGSSPFLAPATLMLVAHVEREGVWLVDGGMRHLAEAMAKLAEKQGAVIRYGAEVEDIGVENGEASGVTLKSGERLDASQVIVNADAAALSAGLFGERVARAVPYMPASARSLSAMTWSVAARTSGFPLSRHSVFFSRDYRAEFADIFERRQLPREPTVYVCAQDRDGAESPAADGRERLFIIVNAPPSGDAWAYQKPEIEECEERMYAQLARCGLTVRAEPDASVATTPEGFERLFPATGGALYGQASHGWTASFTRPAARTRLPGLYLAGGSAHPGPGAPMAALSGRLAAAAALADRTSRRLSRPAATPGGTSTP